MTDAFTIYRACPYRRIMRPSKFIGPFPKHGEDLYVNDTRVRLVLSFKSIQHALS